MSKIEALLARLFIATASVFLCFIAIELAARFYLWHVASEADFKQLASISQIKDRFGDDFFINNATESKNERQVSPHHFLGYYLTPNLQVGENRHNALGYRGDEIIIAKSEGTYRIAAVGGSTTYSTGVDNYRQSYPYHLAEYLDARSNEHVEIINAGVLGYKSYNNLINIQFRLLPLQPDLIIIYQGINDIDTRFVFPSSQYLGDNSGHIAPFISDIVMPEFWEYSTALRILSIRAGITRVHTAIDWHRDSPAASSYRDEFIRQWFGKTYPSGIFEEVSAMEMLEYNPPIHFERNLLNMLAVADRHNVDVLLVTFVTSTAFDRPRVGSDEYIFALSQHNELTRRVAESTGMPLFDLAEVFPADNSLYTDGMHMTARGNQIRAQLIGDYIIREFLSK